MTDQHQTRPLSILRLKQLKARTGLGRSTIYSKQDPNSPQFDPSFPRSIRLATGAGAVGWIDIEVDYWIQACTAKSRGEQSQSAAEITVAQMPQDRTKGIRAFHIRTQALKTTTL